MGKRIEEIIVGGKQELILPLKDKKLKRTKIFYDGNQCEIKTAYPTGTLVGEMKLQHQKYVTKKDL